MGFISAWHGIQYDTLRAQLSYRNPLTYEASENKVSLS